MTSTEHTEATPASPPTGRPADRPVERRRTGAVRKVAFWAPLALLWGLPLAGVLLLAPAADRAEAQAASEPMPDTVLVGSRERTGQRAVSATFDVVAPPAPFVALDGRVTALLYVPGASLAEGDALVEVDGMTLRAHRGDRPFYRDLARGSTGEDVAELARYLAATGVTGATAGPDLTVDDALETAIRAYQDGNGIPADGIFRPGLVVHLDPTTARLTEPEVTVGARVTDGTVLAQGDGVADAGTIMTSSGVPVALDVPGPYVLTGNGDLRVPVDSPVSEGAAAEELRAALRAAGLQPAPGDQPGQESFGGLSIAAAEPVPVGSVAATAIHAGPDGAFCVFRLDPGAPPSSAQAVRLEVATTLDGEVTVAAVDHALAGVSVARVAARLPAAVTSGCR